MKIVPTFARVFFFFFFFFFFFVYLIPLFFGGGVLIISWIVDYVFAQVYGTGRDAKDSVLDHKRN